MQADVDELVAIIGIVIALSIAVGKVVGPLQTDISQAFIDAFLVPSRYRRLLNLGVGVALGTALAVIGAMTAGTWALVPAGILAGVIASVEAARTHDQQTQYADGWEDAERTLVHRPRITRS